MNGRFSETKRNEGEIGMSERTKQGRRECSGRQNTKGYNRKKEYGERYICISGMGGHQEETGHSRAYLQYFWA